MLTSHVAMRDVELVRQKSLGFMHGIEFVQSKR